MPDKAKPTFSECISYLDTFWQELEDTFPALARQEPMVRHHPAFCDYIDTEDELDLKRSCQLALVLLSKSLVSTVVMSLIERYGGLPALAAMGTLARIFASKPDSGASINDSVSHGIALSVTCYLGAFEKLDNDDQAFGQLLDQLHLNETLRKAAWQRRSTGVFEEIRDNRI